MTRPSVKNARKREARERLARVAALVDVTAQCIQRARQHAPAINAPDNPLSRLVWAELMRALPRDCRRPWKR